MDDNTGCRQWGLNRGINPFTNTPTDRDNPELLRRCSEYYRGVCHEESDIYTGENYEEIIRRGGVVVTIPSSVAGRFYCFDLESLAANIRHDRTTRPGLPFRNPMTREPISSDQIELVLEMDGALRGVAYRRPRTDVMDSMRFIPSEDITSLPESWSDVYTVVTRYVNRDVTRNQHRRMVERADRLINAFRIATGERRTRRGGPRAEMIEYIEDQLGNGGYRNMKLIQETSTNDAETLSDLNRMGLSMLMAYVLFAFRFS